MVNMKYHLSAITLKWFFFLYTTSMILTSLIPMDDSPNTPMFWSVMPPSLQNFLHVPMFIGFTYLLGSLMEDLFKKTNRIAIILIISFCMGTLLEMIQSFVPGRYPGLVDILLNLLGAVIGLLVIEGYKRFYEIKQKF